MDKIIKSGESFAYSDKDIKRFLDDDVTILKYPELSNKQTLDDILGGKSCACILYMTKENFGHWTALIKNPGGQDNTYEIFDSLGIAPDEELKFIDDSFRQDSNQTRQHLSHIVASDYKNGRVPIGNVSFGKYKLQKSIKDINTCGRWCAVRCILKRFSTAEFPLLFIDQKLDPDEAVTWLTLINR
jgi:hypothetical protein